MRFVSRLLFPCALCASSLTSRALEAAGITGKKFLIDTGRNGRADVRSSAGSWCNVKGAGLGERPRGAPAPMTDAYLYLIDLLRNAEPPQ